MSTRKSGGGLLKHKASIAVHLRSISQPSPCIRACYHVSLFVPEQHGLTHVVKSGQRTKQGIRPYFSASVAAWKRTFAFSGYRSTSVTGRDVRDWEWAATLVNRGATSGKQGVEDPESRRGYPLITCSNTSPLPPSERTLEAEDPAEDLRTDPPPSWMLGPACALRALSADQTLRDAIRKTREFGALKDLWLSGNLTKWSNPWRKRNKLTTVGDFVLPHIQHWDRLGTLVLDWAIIGVTAPPLIALGLTAMITFTPLFLSYKLYLSVRRSLQRERQCEGVVPVPVVMVQESQISTIAVSSELVQPGTV
ncbi:hypothetical protein BU15DRAFT_62673 [Melanogaster broomeanus]|nr:hypothetical protein BU15DRAFT_62673 [Melanogaster broomeanus]